LPDSIKALYPSTFHRIARGLTTVPHESYIATHGEVGVISTGHADFWRDLRLAAQLAVPLTASRALDRMTFLPRTFYRQMGPKENLRCLRFLVLRLHGLGPLFRTHIDERDPSELDDSGWDRAYLRIAEMLRLHRNIKGTVGTSWSLDPRLDHVSPRRSYGRRNMLAHGAFLHVEGPSEIATQRALKKSATRRRAYERGEYIPTTYSVVWPRRDFLRWAASKAASQG
jgi:hypothetical protein